MLNSLLPPCPYSAFHPSRDHYRQSEHQAITLRDIFLQFVRGQVLRRDSSVWNIGSEVETVIAEDYILSFKIREIQARYGDILVL